MPCVNHNSSRVPALKGKKPAGTFAQEVRAIISKLPAPAPDISTLVKNKRQPEAGLTELLIEGATEFQAVPKVRDYLA